MDLSRQERLDLKRLINESDCENNTDYIREIKHSSKILTDVCILEKLKKTRVNDNNPLDDTEFYNDAQNSAEFLYNNYTDIFHKILKDEIDFIILSKLLHILKMIEDEKIDQHEGSALVGKILKELYIDSAVRQGDKLDKQYKSKEVIKEVKNINWKEFKQKKI